MPEVEREKNESAAVPSPLQAFWKVFLKKIAISRRLLWEELKRLKIKRLDLAKADLRLGEKAYATSWLMDRRSLYRGSTKLRDG